MKATNLIFLKIHRKARGGGREKAADRLYAICTQPVTTTKRGHSSFLESI